MSFGELLRQLRTAAGLTQEELADVARVSARSVSDLERGINRTARSSTARLLADALLLAGPVREQFEAAARGQVPGGGLAVGATVAPRTLPRDIASFTGRDAELRALADAVGESGGVAGIYAVGGMAGVGKTAFAVRAAYHLAARFPDGQVFLPLHGHTPGQRRTEPVDALASLLIATGAGAGQIPAGLEARTAAWRDRLADRRLLLVLDDAADSEQIRPLLPSSGTSLVLVTSRHHLTGLEDAAAISLDALPPEDAAALLTRLAGRSGMDQGDAAIAGVTRLCGYLPLAIGMLARQLHHHPSWIIADLAADLVTARDRLELMATEDLSVRATFDLSYADLPADQQRAFRYLGLHLGHGIDAYAAAALIGADLRTARRLLAALYDHYLLTEPARGRYHFHDLVREHSRALVAEEPPGERDAALGRLLDYYQDTALVAEQHIAAYTRSLPVRSGPAVIRPGLRDTTEALAWARTERDNLLACLDYVTRAGKDSRIVALTTGLSALMQHDGPHVDDVALHDTAVLAARRAGDRQAEANVRHDLGVALYLAGEYLPAAASHEAACAIFRELADRQGEGTALVFLGTARRMVGDLPAALAALETGLAICQDLDDQLGQGWALMDLGMVRYQQGEYPAAVEALKEGLAVYQDAGYQLGQGNTLVFLGVVRVGTGEYPAAAEALEEALSISTEIGNVHVQANALTYLGDLRQRTGDYRGAASALERAIRLSSSIASTQIEANARFYLGGVRQRTGDYRGAADAMQEALKMFRLIGDHAGAAEALNSLGSLDQIQGKPRRARAHHAEALGIARAIGSPRDEAHALAGLARCALAEGRAAEAAAGLRQAREIFERIGDPEAAVISADLAVLDEGAGTSPDITD